MILHLCNHWFWITRLGVLLIMCVIAQDEELSNTNPSHLHPVRSPERSKFKAVLLNVTRLYPVPDRALSSTPESFYSFVPTASPSSGPDDENSNPATEGIYYSTADGTLSSATEVSLSPSPEASFISALGHRGGSAAQPTAPNHLGILLRQVEIVIPGALSTIDKRHISSDNSAGVESNSVNSNNSKQAEEQLPAVDVPKPSRSSESDVLSKLCSQSPFEVLPTVGSRSPFEVLPTAGSQSSSDDLSSKKSASSDGEQLSRIDTALCASEPIESRELPVSVDSGSPSDSTSQFSGQRVVTSSGANNIAPSEVSSVSTAPPSTLTQSSFMSSATQSSPSVSAVSIPSFSAVSPAHLGKSELLPDADFSNQSDRLEREIRKNNASQVTDIHLAIFEPRSDGLELQKPSHHTQDVVRRISTVGAPVNETFLPGVKGKEPYTIFVTPPSPHLTNSDHTTQSLATPNTQTIDLVKKSDNFSKIKEKVDFKTKFSAKTKTTPVKLVETTSAGSTGATSISLSVKEGITVQPAEEVSSHAPKQMRTNSSRMENDQVLNDSTEEDGSQENVTELAFENTSTSADAINHTAASSNINTSTASRNTGGGRSLDTHERVVNSNDSRGRSLDKTFLPQARAEDLHKSNPLNVVLISVLSFGALALLTLFGAVSFIMFRRYRWNKPQTLSDKCSNPDSSGYIDDNTLRENSEEMYSLDNDSFLNSLEAMTIQNYWTDHVKHTKL